MLYRTSARMGMDKLAYFENVPLKADAIFTGELPEERFRTLLS